MANCTHSQPLNCKAYNHNILIISLCMNMHTTGCLQHLTAGVATLYFYMHCCSPLHAMGILMVAFSNRSICHLKSHKIRLHPICCPDPHATQITHYMYHTWIRS